MMKFTCGECGRRYKSTDDPAPGRVYRISCACGNTIAVQMDGSGRPVPPPTPPARRPAPALPPQAATDDPFARAMMGGPAREPAATGATTPVASPPLAQRDPDYAERDRALEASASYPSDEALPETTRSRRLAGTRALLIDATASLRESLAAGARTFLRNRRLVAGGAAIGAIAFALGAWVGAMEAASRSRAAVAAARAEARPGPAIAAEGPAGGATGVGPQTSGGMEPALDPAAARAAARVPAAIAARNPASPEGAAASRRGPRRRPDTNPTRVVAAPIQEATAGAEARANGAPGGEEPAPTADPMPRAGGTAMAEPPEGPAAGEAIESGEAPAEK